MELDPDFITTTALLAMPVWAELDGAAGRRAVVNRRVISLRRELPRLFAAILLLVFAATAQATAQQEVASSDRRGVLALLPPDAVTVHAINIEGRRQEYVAVAGTLPLIDQNGEPAAAIFYTAYSLKDAARETRPLTFVLNGGPGASSAYLHLGLVGPQVVEFSPGPDGAGARLRSNPHPWLSFTDLVLLDPVGTG